MAARRLRAASVIFVAAAASVWTYGATALPATVATVTYTTPGTYEVTAPAGTTCATFVVDGAHGGAANEQVTQDGKGGAGGEVTVSVTVDAPAAFTVIVGGRGGDAAVDSPGDAGA